MTPITGRARARRVLVQVFVDDGLRETAAEVKADEVIEAMQDAGVLLLAESGR